MMIRSVVVSLFFFLTQSAWVAAADFDRTVAPLLIQRCLDCHSGAKPKGGLDLTRRQALLAGGKSGAAITPGKPEESLLWERVVKGQMPPKKPLSDAERALLKEWIATGATWGTEPIDPFRISTEQRAGYDWWSLQPVRRAALPAVRDALWPRHPIDHFILARLEAKGLSPSPEADRRTLIRRISFDLLGLPPTPEEVDAFVRDRDPLAYDKLVDRLLASPHYGERWARHWLDVVRFGESDGFERNTARRNFWHYRNWVIDALNADMPYDEFVRLQLAGDTFRPGHPDSLRALGFLVAGVHNTVVGQNPEMRELARQDELEDLVGSVGQTFLGLTVNCARCHDHKFDPIAQRDFYRLASSLSGVKHGERNLPVSQASVDVARMERESGQLEKELREIEEPARKAVLTDRRQGRAPAPPAPQPLAAWDFRTDLRDHVGGLHGNSVGPVQRDANGAQCDGKTAHVRTVPLAKDLREKTLEAWVRLDNLSQRGGGVMTVQSPDGAIFDAIVFGEKEPGRWLAGSNFYQRTVSFGGPEELDAARETVHLAIAYHADGTIAGYRNGRPYGKSYKSKGPVLFSAGKAVVSFGIRHDPVGGNKMLAGVIVQARLYDRALSTEEVAASAGGSEVITEAELSARLAPELRQRRQELRASLARLGSARAAFQATTEKSAVKVYTALSDTPPVTRLLVRGQVTEPGDVVAPGAVGALAELKAEFGLQPNAPEAERRRKLAEWITHPTNPLLPRIMVNRLWHYHFGVGIVETPNDFGFNGGRPSHPELLDWLASEFAARGYRLKELHRLIVSTNVYRQSSSPRAEGVSADADGRLLWRKKPMRMEGETLRDAMLCAAGLWNPELGGRGFTDYRENNFNGTSYFEPFDAVGPEFNRRSIYRFLPRGGNQGLLDAFDCPDPASAAPRRSITTTPLQALALWNNSFTLRMAETVATRISAEKPDDRDKQVVRAYQLAFQREPRPEEQQRARRLVDTYGLRTLCRALFNANEFLMID